ncbi:hypothetical protein Q1695_001562 [Nippostrongylus brasiliensis]|nr:hypothetical protein Q1695_001562 [Nippostrongylus brasiliensis]
MSDVGATKMCTYIYSVSCSILAEIFMIFGYNNNAWLVLYDDNQQFQRGLNDDCLKTDVIRCQSWNRPLSNSSKFPEPFNASPEPSAFMFIALYVARALLIIQLLWFFSCIVCCCNVNVEKLARKHERSVLRFCAATALAFVMLFLLIVIAYFTDGTSAILPDTYHKTLGGGFWLFTLGGALLFVLSVFLVYRDELTTYIQNKHSHEPLPRQELSTLPT